MTHPTPRPTPQSPPTAPPQQDEPPPSPPPQSADGPSPTTPPGYTPQISAEFSGIDPAALEGFEQSLAHTEDTIGRNEPQIRRTLQRFDLETSRLTALRELQSWIATKRPDLRRRKETIESQQSEWATSPSSGHPALAAFDESLYEKAEHDPDVYAAIVNLTKATESGEVDPKTLTQLEKHAGNSPFALALLTTMGATTYRKTMGDTVGRKQLHRLQVVLGKTLGTASPRLSGAWQNALTTGIGLKWREARGVALALKHGTYPSGFLLNTAKKIDKWYREMSKPMPVDVGVMRDVMTALTKDPALAQDFFTADPTALKYYLTHGHMGDKGAVLGKMLEMALTHFRDGESTPTKPSRGYWSAKLASEFVHLQAKLEASGQALDAFVPTATTAAILSCYIGDINHVAHTGREMSDTGARGPYDTRPPTWGAYFSKKELQSLLKNLFTDSRAFATVMMAQTMFTNRLLDSSAATMAGGGSTNELRSGTQKIGAGFGLLTDAAQLAKIEEGKELDEAQERNMKILAGVINSALALPQVPYAWPITAGIVASWSWIPEDAFKGDAEERARTEANTAVDKTRLLVRDLTAAALLKNGLFGKSAPPDPTHPWASLGDLKRGDDPFKNPNNFVGRDGKTLMSLDQMINGGASNTTDKYRRLHAYDTWLLGPDSGELWAAIRLNLEQSYSEAFNKY
ncbi:hypothetical protein [Spongiactinospora sp. 9N601]|uniref:hypothetical protein n=1 Tax=Spongiactinospora sp. 9N601 TaxID=3375149 RepID=UPI003789049C